MSERVHAPQMHPWALPAGTLSHVTSLPNRLSGAVSAPGLPLRKSRSCLRIFTSSRSLRFSAHSWGQILTLVAGQVSFA
jgi:hypothetical protein